MIESANFEAKHSGVSSDVRTGKAYSGRRTHPILVAFLLVSAAALGPSVMTWGSTAVMAWLAVGAVALTFMFPRVAIFVLVLLMPVDIHIGTGVVSDIFVPVRFAVAVMALLRLRSPGHFGVSRSLMAWTASYLVAVVASLAFAAYFLGMTIPFSSFRAAYQLASYVVFAIAAVQTIKTPNDLRRIYWLLLVGLCATSLYSVYQFASGSLGQLYSLSYPSNNASWNGRPPGLLNYANEAAGYINLLIPMCSAVTLYCRGKWIRLCSGLAVLLAGAALVLTQSRGAWLAAGAVGAIIVIRFAPALLRLPAGIATLLVGLVLAYVVPITSSRVQNIEVNITDSRLALWRAAIRMFQASPVFGVGYGSYESRYPQYLDLDFFGGAVIQAHNLYLQLLAESGVIGLLSFIALVGVAIWLAVRGHIAAHDNESRFAAALYVGVGMALIGVLIHGVVDVLFYASAQFALLFWLLLFIAGISGRMTGAGQVVSIPSNREVVFVEQSSRRLTRRG